MSAPTTTNPVSSSAKRSWRHFTLRALFLVVLAAAVFCGWVAYRVRQFHEQAAFIADLRSRGFRIETEPVVNEWFWGPLAGDAAVQVKTAWLLGNLPDNARFGPNTEDFERMAAWTHLTSLQLYGPTVTDETLAVIRNFRRLDTLLLNGTAIDDAALRHLEGLDSIRFLFIADQSPHHDRPYGTLTSACAQFIARLKGLESLRLYGIPMDEEALRLIALNLKHLRSLNLRKCSITDEGLQHLDALPTVSELSLEENPGVTDVGLMHLTGLKSLREIHAMQTGVSESGAERFEAERPSVNVSCDPQTSNI